MTKRSLITRGKTALDLVRDSFAVLAKNDPLRMAGATAFFTTFALPPILIILFQILGLLFDRRDIGRKLFAKMSDFVGRESVRELIDIARGFRRLAENWYIAIIGFIFLLFVATTLFKVIKGSLNQLWRIKVDRRSRVRSTIRTRSHAAVLILVVGLLFLLGLLFETLQVFVGSYVLRVSSNLAEFVNIALNVVLGVLIVAIWFVILFRYLPDGRPDWRVAITGGIVTSILFNIGKLVFRFMLLEYRNINTVYGTSGSLVLVLLFVFYSALILYFGAAFTKVWAMHCGRPIKPLPHASYYKLSEVESQHAL